MPIGTGIRKDEDKIGVALWGPRSSGKTALLLSFGRKISLLNKDKALEGNYELSLIDRERKVAIDTQNLASIIPTPDMDHMKWSFARKVLGNNISAQVSSHVHNIEVNENQGDVLVEKILEKTVDDPSGMEKVEAARQVLRETDCLIAILNSGANSPEEFLTALQKLRKVLSERTEPCYIAACVTKVDQLATEGRLINASSNVLLVKHFGKNLADKILTELNEKFVREDGHIVRLFVTSATGYVLDGSKFKVNFDPGTNDIADPAKWEPSKVEEPFFWVFETIEKRRLEKRFNASKGLFYRTFGKDYAFTRMENYISYGDMLLAVDSN